MKKAEATRRVILEKAFEMIYRNGYQATSINDILATTKVTKGAFYFHFATKDEMGVAIINELLKPSLTQSFILPLSGVQDPVDAIYRLIRHLLQENDFLKPEYGCPVANFTQEMSPWNKDFSIALNEITHQWCEALVTVLTKGKQKGWIRPDVNAPQVANFVMAGYWGIRNFGKLETGHDTYKHYLKELKKYLQSLK